MNIAIFVDKYESAIDRLAKPLIKYNPHFNIKVLPVHPKRPDIDTLAEAQQLMMWADVIDMHYWKTGDMLRKTFPVEFESKPRLVCHMNPYDTDKDKWQDHYDKIVVGNETIHTDLPYAHLIPYCIDLDFWEFNRNYTKEKVVCMVVARIEGKKGVLPVAQACKKLGYKFILVGRVSDANYINMVISEAGDDFEFKENVRDEELREIYYKSAIHVCNSVDNFESGTLPILESMACGVPVLTRNVGHVPELFNGNNMVIREGQPEEQEELETKLKQLMDGYDWRLKIRESAWDTVKNRQIEKMARMFSGLYYKLRDNTKPLVSVIVPTFDRPEALVECLAGIVAQDYKNIEIVVADSGDISAEPVVRKYRELVDTPIKYLRFENKGEYTLAKARNLAAIEAEGSILVFCDDRLVMDKTAITKFTDEMRPKHWLWGVKDGVRKGFVENFSAVLRSDFIGAGMFNERVDLYGGQTQEIRTRFEDINGFIFLPVEAEAKQSTGSKAKWRKRKEISKAKFIIWKMYKNTNEN